MITTCVILNYNDSETTVELINRIKEYENIDYIVVVDNKSTDNSYNLLKRFESSKIHVLLSDRNGGYGYGNNIGITYSYNYLNSDYTIIANPDVIFSDKTIYELRKVLIENPKVAISSALPMKPNGEKQKRAAWKLPTIHQEIFGASIILNKLFNFRIEYDDEHYRNKEICYVDVVQGSLLMVDTKLMISYGMYDEDFFLYGEEQVIATKLKTKGYKTALLLTESYIHNHSVSISKKYNSITKKRKLMFNSKLIYLKKYHNVNNIIYCFAILFYQLMVIESYIVSILLKIKKGCNDK